ncbi:MAG: hypothetical protein A3H92_03395 [Rhodospirillales bacterium RIFCSPLOWO2_02_FULL_58_16]|nr:MAG: hypothetical protein A3H92_03395 [Rhodospirillales bacterium RIFCSPLOWO2_02_FULL_58_16]
MKDADADTWRVEVAADNNTVKAFESALDPFCTAVSWFVCGDGPQWSIEGYCEAMPDRQALIAALTEAASAINAAPPKIFIHRLKPRDWVAENLTIFPPVEAGRYFIYPTFHKGKAPPGRVSLCLNPGAAFGSGEHASTGGCLLALDRLARRRRFTSALDLGCGSGILAMAVAGTWRAKVIASDLDAKAVLVARDNIRRNRMGRLIRATQSDGYLSPVIREGAPFDLIVCNILAGPLRRMAADLGRHLKKRDGVAVLGGFYIRDANRVLAAHRAQGLRLLCRIDINDWRTLVLARP